MPMLRKEIFKMSPISVLHLEDSITDAELIKETLSLENAQFVITRVDTRDEFNASLDSGKWDVILADYDLPSFNGLEALSISKERCPDIPFIFVSGRIGEDFALETLKQGATDYVLKNRLSRLAPAVSRAMREADERAKRKKSEESLIESNRRLTEALQRLEQSQQQIIQVERLRALGQMASGIAHDFNNALSPIVGFSELLLTSPGALGDNDKVKQYLELIHASAKDAAEVVRRLREFYRTSDTDEENHFPSVDLEALIEQTISMTRPKWKDQALSGGATIYVETDFNPAPDCHCHESALREALTNLIFNAVDAMPAGGTITIRTRREDETGDEKDIASHLVIEISDTGMGMTEEVRKRCLEPFYSTKGEGGTGLGLAMVYGIMLRHGGNVEVDSIPGEGTTFRLRFPLTKPETPKVENNGSEPVIPHSHSSLKVLVVDDEPSIRKVLSGYLSHDGHTAEEAASGGEALEKFFSGYYDLVITDRSMPGMSGDQVALAIRKGSPRTPVVLLTGFGDLMHTTGENPDGVDLILSKPFTLESLRGAVSKVSGKMP